MKNKVLLVVLILLLVGGTASALWIANLRLTGYVTSLGGESPSVETYTWNPSINQSTESTLIIYDNLDGNQTFAFELTHNITSTDNSCVYQEGQDIKFNITLEGGLSSTLDNNNVVYLDMVSGQNNITVSAIPDSNSCPSSGFITLTGTII